MTGADVEKGGTRPRVPYRLNVVRTPAVDDAPFAVQPWLTMKLKELR